MNDNMIMDENDVLIVDNNGSSDWYDNLQCLHDEV